jgi:hypothetical protein
LGEIDGASFGPPMPRPAAYAAVSALHTTTNSHPTAMSP